MAQVIFHESFGDVTRPQLAAYRKHNVSPSDHDDLVRHFGNDHAEIIRYVKANAEDHGGMFNVYFLWRMHCE